MMKYILGLGCLILFAACSSTSVPNAMRVDFKTRITDSGLKHFQLQLIPNKATEEREPPRRRSAEGQGRPNPERRARNVENILLAQAKQFVEQNSYCRDGFWLLDKNLYQRMPYIRAECNETATSQDRERFPDTLLRW